MAPEAYDSFEAVKARLDQIVDAVNDDALPLDDALALYEEAVGLGLRASSLLEENIEERRAAESDADGAAAVDDTFAAAESIDATRADADAAPNDAMPADAGVDETGEPVSA